MYKAITQITLLSLLLGLTAANPIASTPKPAHVLAKRTDQCGTSTSGSIGQADVPAADCLEMTANIVNDGSWGIDPNLSFQQLVSWGQCGFWATSANGVAATVGNQDIIDLVNLVWNEHFIAFGVAPAHMSGNGEMPCEAQGGDGSQPAQVQWFVGNLLAT